MREIKFKAVMQRQDGAMYVSQGYGLDSSFLSYLFDFENNRWDKFLETITTEEKFVKLFPDDDEDLKGWTHIENIQYTGLKDAINRSEVYEHDIINLLGIGFLKVEWDYMDTGWICLDKHYKKRNLAEVLLNGGIRVGNIYENQDLLSEVNNGN